MKRSEFRDMASGLLARIFEQKFANDRYVAYVLTSVFPSGEEDWKDQQCFLPFLNSRYVPTRPHDKEFPVTIVTEVDIYLL